MSGVLSAAYGNGYYVAVDSQGRIFRSDDTLTWEQTAEFPILVDEYDNSFFDVKIRYLAGSFFVFGKGGLFKKSEDASEWEDIDIDGKTVTDIVCDGDMLYAASGITDDDSGNFVVTEESRIYKSNDGTTWEMIHEGLPCQGENLLAAGGGSLMAADLLSDDVYVFISEIRYTYDAYGNIVEKTGEIPGDPSALENAVMTYDADNRLQTYNGRKVSFDENGNMTEGPVAGEWGRFTYDCRNRLAAVDTESGKHSEYIYDAENVRIQSISDDKKYIYVTDREAKYSQLLEEEIYKQNPLGLFTKVYGRTYTYGTGLISHEQTDDPAGSDSGDMIYYHFNNIGSTVAVSDEAGKVVYRFAYGIYGELSGIWNGDGESLAICNDTDKANASSAIRAAIKETGISFLYNGEYGVTTGADGLYYMRSRYYEPQIKRFINRDVLEGSISEGQSLNRYSYVQGDPLKLTDPFGMCGEDRLRDAGHTILDVGGIVFDPCDFVNFVWYLNDGDK
ncbi:MAG: RHS repeat-associated core domain-containing protein, partial [Lachnospiraceae bacterium]|nr:RHS repeat-associated core domain-containing protein [Lachnospiraceae bacterium]